MLIQHQLVAFEPRKGDGSTASSSDGPMGYSVVLDNVLRRARLPRFIHTAKALFGNAGELIVEDMLQQGQSLMSQVITCGWYLPNNTAISIDLCN